MFRVWVGITDFKSDSENKQEWVHIGGNEPTIRYPIEGKNKPIYTTIGEIKTFKIKKSMGMYLVPIDELKKVIKVPPRFQ